MTAVSRLTTARQAADKVRLVRTGSPVATKRPAMRRDTGNGKSRRRAAVTDSATSRAGLSCCCLSTHGTNGGEGFATTRQPSHSQGRTIASVFRISTVAQAGSTTGAPVSQTVKSTGLAVIFISRFISRVWGGVTVVDDGYVRSPVD